MIGTPAFLLDAAFPVFFALMFCGILMECSRKRERVGVVASFVLLAVAILTGHQTYQQHQKRRVLQTLRADQVERIRVGDHRLREPAQIEAVVKDLNGIDCFKPNHGGWGEWQWLIVEPKEGERRLYRVAKYQREEGAVIRFAHATPKGTVSSGYAFSRTLPKTLAELGISLEMAAKP